MIKTLSQEEFDSLEVGQVVGMSGILGEIESICKYPTTYLEIRKWDYHNLLIRIDVSIIDLSIPGFEHMKKYMIGV